MPSDLGATQLSPAGRLIAVSLASSDVQMLQHAPAIVSASQREETGIRAALLSFRD